jgi:hypothetical protein
MKISGKVNSKGEINTKIRKGCSLSFKIDGFDEDLSVWAFNPEQMKEKMPADIGDFVEVEYDENGDFNSVKKVKIVDENSTKAVTVAPAVNMDFEIRKSAMTLAYPLQNSPVELSRLISDAQVIEHYLRSGEKFGEFKEAGK